MLPAILTRHKLEVMFKKIPNDGSYFSTAFLGCRRNQSADVVQLPCQTLASKLSSFQAYRVSTVRDAKLLCSAFLLSGEPGQVVWPQGVGLLPIAKTNPRWITSDNKLHRSSRYCRISVTLPAPTVCPPSRMANLSPFSMAMGVIRSISRFTLSPGITISVPAGSVATPVTSVVRK